MFGGQQIRAYKHLTKTSRFMPRHTQADIALFRVIVWGAVAVLAVAVAALLAAQMASFTFSSDPVFLRVIPAALALIFCWYWTDVAPVASRRLVVTVAFAASIYCLVSASLKSNWELAQFAMLIVYFAAAIWTAWKQLRMRLGENDETENI
jgi:hypothetical protein